MADEAGGAGDEDVLGHGLKAGVVYRFWEVVYWIYKCSLDISGGHMDEEREVID